MLRSSFGKRALCTLIALLIMAPLAFAQIGSESVSDDSEKKVEALDAKSVNGVLVFESEDGSQKWWFDSRVYIDQAFYIEDKNTLSDGAELRRGRFAVKTILYNDWYAEFDFDLSDEQTEVKDAYLRYDNLFGRTGYFRMGNFRQPYGLEENTTSRYLMFLERSVGTDGFVPGRLMGIEVCKFNPHYRIAASICGQDVEDYDTSDDETNGFAARGTFTPINEDRKVVHLGAAYYQHLPNLGTGKIDFDVRPETHVNRAKYYDTGKMSNVANRRQAGMEVGLLYNRFFFQSEYTAVTVVRETGFDDYNFGGGYAFFAFFLTDDTHPYYYDSAEFGRVIPKSKMGAVELAFRYSTIDMNDKDVYGGSGSAITAALNWYANPNIRFMLDYTMLDNDQYADGNGSLVGNDDFSVLQFRMLVAF